jgi:hypothetical protein
MSKLQVDQVSKTSAGADTFTLPASDGSADQTLKTDGSGQLGWSTPPVAGTNAPAFSVCTNAITAITAATNTKIVLDREIFDSNSAFDATTNYRFTVPADEAGKYLISAGINFLMASSSTTSNIQTMIYLNGSEHGTSDSVITNQANITNLTVEGTWILDLAVADYIELWGYVSGSSTQYNGNATLQKTHMSGFKLIGV